MLLDRSYFALQATFATRVADMMNKAYAALQDSRQSKVENRQTELTALNNDLATVYGIIEEVDAAPTTQTVNAVTELEQRVERLEQRFWPRVLRRVARIAGRSS